MKRTPLKKVSKKRAGQNNTYSKLRKEFLAAHPYCQWWLAEHGLTEANVSKLGFVTLDDAVVANVPTAIDIHHKRGRFGSRLNETEFWMAVSREGHDAIHKNPNYSYQKGYMINR